MLRQAEKEHGIDLGQSVMIGDSRRDVEAGRAVGARSILVLTGFGRKTLEENPGADHVAEDLAAAADWLRKRTT